MGLLPIGQAHVTTLASCGVKKHMFDFQLDFSIRILEGFIRVGRVNNWVILIRRVPRLSFDLADFRPTTGVHNQSSSLILAIHIPHGGIAAAQQGLHDL